MPRLPSLRTTIPLVLSFALASCQSNPSGATCTEPDIGKPCSGPDVVESIAPGEWRVVLKNTVREDVEYRDGGALCVYTETRCVLEECAFFGGGLTAAEALSECRERYAR